MITEKAQLDRIVDIEGSHKIKFTAPLDIIKSRFAQRMNGKLPQPVEKMIDNQYEQWETIKGDMNVDTTVDSDIKEIVDLIASY